MMANTKDNEYYARVGTLYCSIIDQNDIAIAHYQYQRIGWSGVRMHVAGVLGSVRTTPGNIINARLL